MSVLCAFSIENNIRIEPFVYQKTRHACGATYGLSEAGYDIRLSETDPSSKGCIINGRMLLAVSMEKLYIPNTIIAYVHDKSHWARQGIAVQNTVLEPGWYGYITLELSYHGSQDAFKLFPGMPIAQVCFHWLDAPAKPYAGRYQDQPEQPVQARIR